MNTIISSKSYLRIAFLSFRLCFASFFFIKIIPLSLLVNLNLNLLWQFFNTFMSFDTFLPFLFLIPVFYYCFVKHLAIIWALFVVFFVLCNGLWLLSTLGFVYKLCECSIGLEKCHVIFICFVNVVLMCYWSSVTTGKLLQISNSLLLTMN